MSFRFQEFAFSNRQETLNELIKEIQAHFQQVLERVTPHPDLEGDSLFSRNYLWCMTSYDPNCSEDKANIAHLEDALKKLNFLVYDPKTRQEGIARVEIFFNLGNKVPYDMQSSNAKKFFDALPALTDSVESHYIIKAPRFPIDQNLSHGSGMREALRGFERTCWFESLDLNDRQRPVLYLNPGGYQITAFKDFHIPLELVDRLVFLGEGNIHKALKHDGSTDFPQYFQHQER